uniref:Uncharacterized protein n=1 Tax=Arundo donax TaxID=35708 RepID=A0A0A9HHV2_ARUDO
MTGYFATRYYLPQEAANDTCDLSSWGRNNSFWIEQHDIKKLISK